MKLDLSISKLIELIHGIPSSKLNDGVVQQVIYDTRRIIEADACVFFALKGVHADGHQFIADAYQKGVRIFVVSESILTENYHDARFIQVADTLQALMDLAFYFRKRLKGKVGLISGKIGKTSTKEWLYHVLSPEFSVSRSPKSYNSTLGIALSLLEAKPNADFVLIEVKVHSELNPKVINELIQPHFGILTKSISYSQQLYETYLTDLFANCESVFLLENDFNLSLPQTNLVTVKAFQTENNFTNDGKRMNVALVAAVAQYVGLSDRLISEKLKKLPELALRLETFEGKNGNFVIVDLYNLDLEVFRSSLEYQMAIAGDKKRAVILGNSRESMNQDKLYDLVHSFHPDYSYFLNEGDAFDDNLKDTIILIKGNSTKKMLRIANQLKEKRHNTELRINLESLRKNIATYRKQLPEKTKLMVMLKASGYGSGVDKIAQFITGFGVDYFGVAFVDEGVAIRNVGITKPILVMNAESENYEACINYQLEPAIFDFEQLDDFISECIYQGVEHYPIHLKIDTGMNRLGFRTDEITRVLEMIQSQPEVRIKSVYSHLVEADNLNDLEFTRHQIEIFRKLVEIIKKSVNYSVEQHILNSSGIENFPHTGFSMARLGIGMYGISSNPKFQLQLEPVISWYSTISQLKCVKTGQSIGYSRSHICKKDTLVATIPVGYADGLRRSLSNGVGFLSVKGRTCPIVGRVCMDMVMIDVTGIPVKVGDEVEIIGQNCSLNDFAALCNTIPYEVMTSISQRVQKIYIA